MRVLFHGREGLLLHGRGGILPPGSRTARGFSRNSVTLEGLAQVMGGSGSGGGGRKAGRKRTCTMNQKQLRNRCTALGIPHRDLSVKEMQAAIGKRRSTTGLQAMGLSDLRNVISHVGKQKLTLLPHDKDHLQRVATATLSATHQISTRHTYTLGEFFSGIGGAFLGGQMAGFRSCSAYDLDVDANKVYQLNHGIVPRQLDLAKSPKTITQVDVQWASPPCQPWSSVNRIGPFGLSAPAGRLMLKLPALFHASGAAVMLIEQVPNIVHINGGRDFKRIIELFKNDGHTVQHRRIDASRYDLPQKRVRLIITVARKGLRFTLPALVPGHAATGRLKKRLKFRGCCAKAKKTKTIRASGGGSNDQKDYRTVELANGSVHILAVADMLRVQGFPRGFSLPKDMSMTTKQRLIGNAVPPPLVAALLRAVRAGLSAAKYEPRL